MKDKQSKPKEGVWQECSGEFRPSQEQTGKGKALPMHGIPGEHSSDFAQNDCRPRALTPAGNSHVQIPCRVQRQRRQESSEDTATVI